MCGKAEIKAVLITENMSQPLPEAIPGKVIRNGYSPKVR